MREEEGLSIHLLRGAVTGEGTFIGSASDGDESATRTLFTELWVPDWACLCPRSCLTACILHSDHPLIGGSSDQLNLRKRNEAADCNRRRRWR